MVLVRNVVQNASMYASAALMATLFRAKMVQPLKPSTPQPLKVRIEVSRPPPGVRDPGTKTLKVWIEVSRLPPGVRDPGKPSQFVFVVEIRTLPFR